MNRKLWMARLLASVVSLFVISCVYAAKPLWTFTPLTPTSIAVPPNQDTVVEYLVMNQSHKAHNLRVLPKIGIRQVSLCSLSPKGTPGDTCTLSLLIQSKFIPRGGFSGGPVLCQTGSLGLPNPNQCYQPSAANILNISFASAIPTLGGKISGLDGTVVLQVNGANPESFSTDGPFTLSTIVPVGSPYNVTVQTQPAGHICSVSNGSGIMPSTPVTNILVTCAASDQTYTLGGTTTDVVTLNNNAGETKTVGPGAFTFDMALANGTPYDVVVVPPLPAGKTCTVENGKDSIMGMDVTNIKVVCALITYTIGGTATGLLNPSPQPLILVNNGNDQKQLFADGNFLFSPVAAGSDSIVEITQQPTDRACTFDNGATSIEILNISANVNLPVTCTDTTTTLVLDPNKIIVTINSTAATVTITNTGNNPANGINVVLPSGWVSNVNFTLGPNCNPIPANGGTCQISFASNLPFIADNVIVTFANAPTLTFPVAFAFRATFGQTFLGLFYGWKLNPATPSVPTNIAMGILTQDSPYPVSGPATLAPWSSSTQPYVNICGINENNIANLSCSSNPNETCYGAIDGKCDSAVIFSRYTPPQVYDQKFAAAYCRNLDTSGISPKSIYLPAACQLNPDVVALTAANGFSAGQNVCQNTANIQDNLINKGFGNFVESSYWSSTQDSANPANEAWFAVPYLALPDVHVKYPDPTRVRCGIESSAYF